MPTPPHSTCMLGTPHTCLVLPVLAHTYPAQACRRLEVGNEWVRAGKPKVGGSQSAPGLSCEQIAVQGESEGKKRKNPGGATSAGGKVTTPDLCGKAQIALLLQPSTLRMTSPYSTTRVVVRGVWHDDGIFFIKRLTSL